MTKSLVVQGKEGGKLFYFGSKVKKYYHLGYAKGYGYWTLSYGSGVAQKSPSCSIYKHLCAKFIKSWLRCKEGDSDEHFLKCFKTELTED